MRCLLVPIYIVTILALFLNNESLAARIGNNYEQQMPVPGVKAPSVRIESLSKIKPGESVDLTADAKVDKKHNGEAFYYWYTNQGTFSPHPSYPDYSTVTYTAPNTPGDVTITAQVGDTLGYVGTDRFTIAITGGTNGNPGTDPPAPSDCTYTVTPTDWQDKYHVTYRLTIEQNAAGTPVGRVSIQPTTGNMRWDYSGTVRLLIGNKAVNIYKNIDLTYLHGKAETYNKNDSGLNIYFSADFTTKKRIKVEHREDRYGRWFINWQAAVSCPEPGSTGIPDLIVDTAEVDPLRMEPGARANTRVRIANIGTETADTFRLGCYLSANGSTWDAADTLLYQQRINKLIQGRNTLIEKRVTLPKNASGDYHLIFRADNKGNVAEENEGNNEIAVAVEIRDFADLTIRQARISPAKAAPGEAVTLSAKVNNSGGTGTLASSRLGYYLSADKTWDRNDILLGTSPFGSLLPGKSTSLSRTVTLPSDLSRGRHYIIFYADAAEKVSETDTGNNQAAVRLRVAYSRRMTVFTPNAGTSWTPDRAQTIQWASNLDGTVKIELYKSLSLSRTIATAAPNTGSFVWNIPANIGYSEKYWIKITSNARSSVSDDSERFTITKPDTLTVNSPGNGAELSIGTTSNIRWDSRFDGAVDIDLYKAGAFYQAIEHNIPIARSDDGIYAWAVPADLPEGSDYQIRVGHSSYPSPWDMSDGYFTIIDPNTGSGDCFSNLTSAEQLFDRSISYRLQLEQSADGTQTGHFYIQPTTGDFTWSYSGSVGVQVNGTPVNLYTDADLQQNTGKRVIYHAGHGKLSFWIKDDFQEDAEIVVEHREDSAVNPWYPGPWTVEVTCSGTGGSGTPDLTVDSAETDPLRLGPGASTFTRARVSNIGDGPADPSALACYLSADNSWDSGDTLLYRHQFNSIIDGRNAFVEQNVTLPSGLSSGEYYLIFRADDQGNITEADESNNEAIVAIEVITGADLTLSNTGVSPANVTPGQAVTLNARVTNSGGTGTLASSRIGYYLSADASWDSGDTLLATNAFGSLLPGQRQDFSRTLTLPSDLTDGQQYIIFYADYADNVTETDKGNNWAAASIQVAVDQNMTITIPDATTSWPYNRQQTIQWVSNRGGTVKIELYKSLHLEQTITASAPNTGSFLWTVPELQPEDHYWIRITSNTDSSITDDTERFTITRPATLTVLSPSNGDVFGLGTVRNINWETSFNGTVDIDLYTSGALYRSIAQNVATVFTSTNSYAWSVPADLAEGTDYKIKVTHSADPATTDLCDGSFTIADPSTEEPLAEDDAAVTEEDIAALINVLANDNPPTGETLDVTDISDPANGTALLNGDETITYTPDSGFTGSDSFTYTVTSPSRGTASATVYVTVNETVSCDPWELPPDVLDLARDDAGNIFVVGTFQSSITLGTETPVTLVAPAEMPAMYIAKYTASGTLLWAREAIGGTNLLRCKAGVDTTGNLYLTGDYYTTLKFYDGNALVATLSSTPGSACEIFIAKYTPTGELAWTEQAGGQWDDYGTALAVDSAAGRLYIGGMFNETLKIGNGATATTLNSADNSDLFLAQYTLDGTPLWTQQGTGQGSGMIFSIAAKNESILATGYYDETLTFSGSTPVTLLPIDTGDKFFVAKFNADDGKARWAQKAGGAFSSIGWDITTDDSDQVYATGHYYDDIDFYNGSTIFRSLTNSHDTMFMIKYRSDGTPEWTHQAGGASRGSMSVTLDETGNPLFTGAFNQYPAVFTTGPSGQTAMSNTSGAGLYNSNGNFLGFAEPGIDLILAEESLGNPSVIGRGNKVMPCDTLLLNIPPVAADDTVSTVEEQSVTVSVLNNDSDPEGDSLSVTEVTQGVNGSVAIEPDGLNVTYTPDAWFIGTDNFNYTIDDGNRGTASATVTILVTSSTTELSVTDIQPINSSAVALNQVFTFTLNEPVTAGSCYSNISLKDNGSTPAAINTTVSGNILTVEPAAVLAAGTEYLITVPSCALAGTTGGNTLAANFTHSFTTESGSASVLFIDIAAGYDHAIALDSDGNVWAWGRNDYGQAGDSSLTDQLTPVQVQGLTGITQIAAGAYHNLALDSFGTVWAWGQNGDGQLGNGTKTNSTVPVPVSGLSDIIAIATGTSHSIALKGNGTVWTWGTNSYYELGHGLGGTTDELVPGQVPNLFNVIDIAGGYNFTTVLKQNNTVWSWGRNRAGQLGTGDTTDRNIPVAALLPATVDSIHASLSERAFAVMSDGSVWGWGNNGSYGAVGNGSGLNQLSPVKVFENTVHLSSGKEHTVALASDDSLWAWGRNMEGEYGTGNTSYSTTPVPAANLADITTVATGGNFTVILKENGTIWCWGSNGNGKLGNNSTDNSQVPVQVVMGQP